MVKTDQAILIGVYDEKMHLSNAADIVEHFADYLLENGY